MIFSEDIFERKLDIDQAVFMMYYSGVMAKWKERQVKDETMKDVKSRRIRDTCSAEDHWRRAKYIQLFSRSA
jgi:hypothetical protein